MGKFQRQGEPWQLLDEGPQIFWSAEEKRRYLGLGGYEQRPLTMALGNDNEHSIDHSSTVMQTQVLAARGEAVKHRFDESAVEERMRTV